MQRPWGSYMPGKFVEPRDYCGWSGASKEKSGRGWHQRVMSPDDAGLCRLS